jgi:hypothetical protein
MTPGRIIMKRTHARTQRPASSIDKLLKPKSDEQVEPTREFGLRLDHVGEVAHLRDGRREEEGEGMTPGRIIMKRTHARTQRPASSIDSLHLRNAPWIEWTGIV